MRDGFKLGVPHSDGCFFAAREETPDFIVYDGFDSTLKKNGHKGGSTWWHRFSCNSPIRGEGWQDGCAGRLLVRWDVLNDLLKDGQQ